LPVTALASTATTESTSSTSSGTRHTHEQAVKLIQSFQRFPVQDITSEILTATPTARQRYRLSCWDAAIIEASRAMGYSQVLSDDLNDGQDYGGVRVTNPFH
jgi:predicted nucleic acid-binding protein